MNNPMPQSLPVFEPHSVYLLYIESIGLTLAGVFHHNKDNKGKLIYCNGPGLPNGGGRYTVRLSEQVLRQSK